MKRWSLLDKDPSFAAKIGGLPENRKHLQAIILQIISVWGLLNISQGFLAFPPPPAPANVLSLNIYLLPDVAPTTKDPRSWPGGNEHEFSPKIKRTN